MKKVKTVERDGMRWPDWPANTNWPPMDPEYLGATFDGNEYTLYYEGDEIPDEIKPRLHVLTDLPDDLVVWRYMDFTRFYSLIVKQALYFTPGGILRKMEPYEFRMPIHLEKSLREITLRNYETYVPSPDERLRLAKRDHLFSEERYLYYNGISCWHVNQVENHALWKVFVPDGSGVAVKSTLGRLKKSLDLRKRAIFVRPVSYIDYMSDGYAIDPNKIGFDRIFSKAEYFTYENELRLAYDFPADIREFEARVPIPEFKDPAIFGQTQREYFLLNGPLVPVDLDALISEVVVSPLAGTWLHELVEELVRGSSTPISAKVTRSVVGRWIGEEI